MYSLHIDPSVRSTNSSHLKVEGFFRTRRFKHNFSKLVLQLVFGWDDAGTLEGMGLLVINIERITIGRTQRESIHTIRSMLQVNAFTALINMPRPSPRFPPPLLFLPHLPTFYPLALHRHCPITYSALYHISMPPPNYLYINNQQPHSLLCTSITPPEDELQHHFRKFVIKFPCPEEAFYFQIFYSRCPYIL